MSAEGPPRTAVPRPRVLLTLTDVPHPADRGKRMRQAALLHGLAAVARVDVAVLLPSEAAHDGAVPASFGAERSAFFSVELHRRWRALWRVARHRVPWQVAVRRYGQVQLALAAWAQAPYDLVVLGSLDHEVALRGVVPAARTVVDLDDVETDKQCAFLALPKARDLRGRLERGQRRLELPMWQRLQEQACERNEAVLVCSELDRERLGHPSATVVPNTYADPGERVVPQDGPPVLLMVGTWQYGPNSDSARFAAREILPLIRRRVPAAQLRLVGAGSTGLADLVGLDGVQVVGYVDDLRDELRRASLTLVPWRYGGGTRLKVLEALAWGLPLVSTSLGCEGLDLLPGVHALVADDATSLAAAAVSLLEDRSLRQRYADAGHEHYRARFTPDVADAALAAVVASSVRRQPV